ncbi:MAG TPA: NAD-binding protein [Sulfurovum sp.]|uniref:potassium channel family protein n=1 Tax=Sulfurovum sp. TaxID=1969726 RepID=UPI002F93D430
MNNSALFLILQKMRAPFLVLIVTYTIAIIGLVSIDGIDNEGNPYRMTIFDAFYFISYTATTIGFGETPYTFSYQQRIWVSMIIYLTVIGWFYSIGSLISLIQDKVFRKEIAKSRFIRQIRHLDEHFFIILGYNATTKKIIEKSLKKGFRVVVIEKNEEKVSELHLQSYTPVVHVLQADIHDPNAIEAAGIKSPYCKGLVSLFEDDSLNLRIAITTKIINPDVPLAIKSTTKNLTENLKDVGVEIIENPFDIISNQIDLSLNSPSIHQLAKWIFNLDTLEKQSLKLPRGKYIVCGYGRMGKEIYKVLEKNNIEASFIEIDPAKISKSNTHDIVIADADDKDILIGQGIRGASVIIAGTNNDTTNLSLLATAKKLNPDILTIARENELENYSIFQYSNIDYLFMPSRILIHKTINALVNPMSDRFLDLMKKETEHAAAELIEKLLQKIGGEPKTYELKIDERSAFAIVTSLHEEKTVTLKHLLLKREDNTAENAAMVLLLQRGSTLTLLPSEDTKLEVGDQLLLAADEEAINDIEYIAQNIIELAYVTNHFQPVEAAHP